jgi:hypothetical protein
LRFEPYFRDGAARSTAGRHALLRVRVSDDVRSTDHVAVYLETGTELVVPTRELVVLAADDPITTNFP